jgi:membrane-bound ClpP family serine protease
VLLQEILDQEERGLRPGHRAEWRAESMDGSVIPLGSAVRVADVEGTRVIVSQVGEIRPASRRS